ncbi:hypothetical protein TVAG_075620 [Trichomonas vaginalis G3]|uniref:Glycosyltransferase 61 catalytic domain-containing protein n=1 Tax=Trichomonas vaginalis (strain ATCC PRA-98 / G3) TaxID=412133 RepID=A2D9F9_TRIV3|nr:glycosyltransferase 61 family [Trichomonas vaginalis G3]EAY22815.1 hypothetical protein TVAG_075620 [Trichomonas vaginalis G3]KAI5526972.1 glycosyltransferase 61 family [Trichomonas vaginalis G3]|eukprot:XP_001583801.1 hypothetical protein [Trichomonas vaginalis G3]
MSIMTIVGFFTFNLTTVLEEPEINFDQLVLTVSNVNKDLYFRFEGVGASAYSRIYPFCKENKCEIPLIIGGDVKFSLIYRRFPIYTKHYIIEHAKMNCTNEPWTNRICTFRDICYANKKYHLISPYNITFEEKLLCLGAKTPPVDLELNRFENMIDTWHEKPLFGRHVVAHSFLVSIYYNMHMLWHQYFDFLLPLYQTMVRDGPFDNRSIVYLPTYATSYPMQTNYLSLGNKVAKMELDGCFEQLTMGMVKITDLSLDKDDPPYSFCNNCSSGLRNIILRKMNINDTSKSPIAVILARKGNVRFFNVDVVEKVVKKLLPKYKVKVEYFENVPIEKQMKIMSKASLFVSIHGSGLSHILWMKPGTCVIELKTWLHTCNDWYQKAARATGIHYMAYYPHETLDKPSYISPYLQHCIDNRIFCGSKHCKDALRDQNITVNAERFENGIKEFVNNHLK